MMELLYVIIGAVAVKLLDYFFISRKDKGTETIELVKSLQVRVTGLANRLDKVQAEIDEWKKKYFTLLGEHTALKQKYLTLKGEFDRFKRKYQHDNK